MKLVESIGNMREFEIRDEKFARYDGIILISFLFSLFFKKSQVNFPTGNHKDKARFSWYFSPLHKSQLSQLTNDNKLNVMMPEKL